MIKDILNVFFLLVFLFPSSNGGVGEKAKKKVQRNPKPPELLFNQQLFYSPDLLM